MWTSSVVVWFWSPVSSSATRASRFKHKNEEGTVPRFSDDQNHDVDDDDNDDDDMNRDEEQGFVLARRFPNAMKTMTDKKNDSTITTRHSCSFPITMMGSSSASATTPLSTATTTLESNSNTEFKKDEHALLDVEHNKTLCASMNSEQCKGCKGCSFSVPINEESVQKSSSSSSSSAAAALPAVSELPTNSLSRTFQFVLLCTLSVQTAAFVLLGRYTRSSRPPEELYDIRHLVLASEALKLLISCILEGLVSTRGQLLTSLYCHVWKQPCNAFKAAVPAILYVLQNICTFVALSHLSAPIYLAASQTKLVMTAAVSAVLLQRRYQLRQWMCLFTLSVGLAMILMEQQQQEAAVPKDDKLPTMQNTGMKSTQLAPSSLLMGLSAVAGASFCSAFASVFMEAVMKRDDQTKINTDNGTGSTTALLLPISLWMRNIQLSFFGIVVAASQCPRLWIDAQYVLSSGWALINKNGSWYNMVQSSHDQMIPTETMMMAPPIMFHHFTIAVWCAVIMQAGGGLLVAAVMKYTDNVMKGLAIAVASIQVSLISCWYFGVDPTQTFLTGAGIILMSVYYFSNPLPRLERIVVFRTIALPIASRTNRSRCPYQTRYWLTNAWSIISGCCCDVMEKPQRLWSIMKHLWDE